MAEKKPITDERARQFYVHAYAWDMGNTPSPGQERAREVQAREWDAWLAAHDARVRRDAALHEKQRIAGEVRLWASINDDLGYTESAETLTRAANDIDRIPEESP